MAPTRPPAQPGPRTQAQRRAETRAALLDATIESLVSYGYAGTTTGRIAELAGVSRGAQTPYFRNRAELVGAAVQYLAERRIEAAHERFADGPVTPEQALDEMWEEHKGPVFDAALELWVASRTDADMRQSLVKVEREVAAAIAAEAVSAFGDRARSPGFTDDLIFVLATIRGLALLRISHGMSAESLEKRWIHSREYLVKVLAG